MIKRGQSEDRAWAGISGALCPARSTCRRHNASDLVAALRSKENSRSPRRSPWATVLRPRFIHGLTSLVRLGLCGVWPVRREDQNHRTRTHGGKEKNRTEAAGMRENRHTQNRRSSLRRICRTALAHNEALNWDTRPRLISFGHVCDRHRVLAQARRSRRLRRSSSVS